MRKILTAALAVMVVSTAGCGTSSSTADEVGSKVEEELFRNSYKRQCSTMAVIQGVPNEDANPICECTADKVTKGRTKAEVAAMPEQETQAALDACIAEHQEAQAGQ